MPSAASRTLRLLFSRQWWWTTLLVIAAIGVMVRLGKWQLDRLAQRRAFNARVNAQLAQPRLDLSGDMPAGALTEMEYRSATATGKYDFSQQVALRNQAWENRAGVHLITPLVIAGTDRAVLVDRGWIPLEDSAPENWDEFAEPGIATVAGVIRLSRSRPNFGGLPDPEGRLTEWNSVNIERIAQQVSYPLLPIYIQQAPDPAWSGLPYRSRPDLDLSEGSHLGYAIQWFLFATVLAIGYPRFVRQNSRPATVGPAGAHSRQKAVGA